jgi:MFS family permease
MAMRDPSANALIAEHGGKKKVASAFAWYQTARTVASSISKAAAGGLLAITASNFNFVFGLAFFLSLAPLIVVLLFVDEPKHREHVAVNDPSQNAQQSKPSIVPYIGLGFLIASTAEMLSGMFPVLATEYAHLSKAQAGLVYGVSTVVTLIAGPVFGWLSDHVSRKLVLMVRSVANTLSSLLYIAWPTFAGIGIAKTMDDAGKAAFRPAWGALMAQISGYDKSTRARTVSWMSMGEDAGGVFAPMLAGFLWSTWGIGALMGVRIALAIGTEIYAVIVARAPDEPRDDKEAFSTADHTEGLEIPVATATRA